MVVNRLHASVINFNNHFYPYQFVVVLPMDSGISAAPVVASETDPSVSSRPPRRRERKKSTPTSPKLTSNGLRLPPTPKVHTGACFFKSVQWLPFGHQRNGHVDTPRNAWPAHSYCRRRGSLHTQSTARCVCSPALSPPHNLDGRRKRSRHKNN